MRPLEMNILSVGTSHTLSILTKWLSLNERFLDVGCNTAEIDYFLELNGYNNVYCTDIEDFVRFFVQGKKMLGIEDNYAITESGNKLLSKSPDSFEIST